MNDYEKLVRDIDGLKDSIRLSWIDMDRLPMTPIERAAIRRHISDLTDHLKLLIEKMEVMDADRT